MPEKSKVVVATGSQKAVKEAIVQVRASLDRASVPSAKAKVDVLESVLFPAVKVEKEEDK